MQVRRSLPLGLAILLAGCAPTRRPEPAPVQASVPAGLTPHFRRWLEARGLAGQHFERDDLAGGSFGGRHREGDEVRRIPVVFIHGNSDRALGQEGSSTFTGWMASLAYFQAKGYAPWELYATTWGPADRDQGSRQTHGRAYLMQVRAFLRAVKDYTGAEKVSVVAHSMGVTLARKAILGGPGVDAEGAYDLGAPLTPMIDTFVGIAGANLGLQACAQVPDLVPACSTRDGFFPGYGPDGKGLSAFLAGLQVSSHYEGARVYAIWSTEDALIGPGNLAWGRATSPIPGQDGEKVFREAPYGHIGVKDLTAHHQWRMVAFHETD